ncbi:MAG: sigma-70 family RNA polymerase sigma factor [Planctomycetes bacterium]|nr:sigma-70 family RNA polymerase sigma factor [Planctomycetota bacterium]
MSESSTTRPSLLLRLRDPQEREAWSQFVHIYSPLVYRIARRAGFQDADAADVTQEVMQTVARSMPKFEYDRNRGSFRGWLKTVTRSRIADHQRRLARQAEVGRDSQTLALLEHVPDDIDNEEIWEIEYRQSLFQWAAEQSRNDFQPSTWSAFWRTSVQGTAVKAVAEELRMSVGAVYIARSRVTAHLKKLIAQVEGDDA